MIRVVMFCWASFCRPDPAEPRAFDSIDECRELAALGVRSLWFGGASSAATASQARRQTSRPSLASDQPCRAALAAPTATLRRIGPDAFCSTTGPSRGSVPRSGRGGRRSKSCHSDHENKHLANYRCSGNSEPANEIAKEWRHLAAIDPRPRRRGYRMSFPCSGA
jgi:hypothetical protein